MSKRLGIYWNNISCFLSILMKVLNFCCGYQSIYTHTYIYTYYIYTYYIYTHMLYMYIHVYIYIHIYICNIYLLHFLMVNMYMVKEPMPFLSLSPFLLSFLPPSLPSFLPFFFVYFKLNSFSKGN